MAKITHIFSGLTNGLNYYGKIYSMNPNGRVNNRADLKVFSAIPSEFPAVPDSYILIDTYTTSQTFTAPEDGWFKIELHGASGNGAAGMPQGGEWYSGEDDNGYSYWFFYSGPSGGGGAYVASAVKMKQGDTIELVCGAVGSETTATITSSMETYSAMSATSGGNATQQRYVGVRGEGGIASGGNVSNVNGNPGSTGSRSANAEYSGNINISATPGGNAGHADGNQGENGQYAVNGSKKAATSGKAGFFKISRGNTNLA